MFSASPAWVIAAVAAVSITACMGNLGGASLASSSQSPDPGSVVLRRLNRAEYSNSVRDLLAAAPVSGALLPADTESYGFDNVGSGLTLSPTDTQTYEAIAESLAATAATPGSAGYQKLVSCAPQAAGTTACLQQSLQALANRAWRRPVTQDEVAALMSVANAASGDPNGFSALLAQGITMVLMSPNFLFKVELDTNPSSTDAHPLSPYELATRLSYFLWSTTPDDTLLAAAAANALQTDAQLTAQVKRMLADPKAAAFSQNFAGQWLELRLAQSAQPDATVYPTFDPNVQSDMVAETQQFFQTFLDQDLPLSSLLTANFSFINDRLAKFYGMPLPGSSSLTQVTLSPNQRRGLMTQGSVLLATSDPDAGSPVLRGKYVLAQLLCQAIPPPPAGVPPLSATTLNPNATMRQRLEAHVSNPTCAACHNTMDPIGFAYEGFDGTGASRTTDNGQPVDTTGSLPDGQTFVGPFDLAAILGADPRLSACAVQQMFVYALGRGTTSADSGDLQTLTNTFNVQGQKLSQLITMLVLSNDFRTRRGGN